MNRKKNIRLSVFLLGILMMVGCTDKITIVEEYSKLDQQKSSQSNAPETTQETMPETTLKAAQPASEMEQDKNMSEISVLQERIQTYLDANYNSENVSVYIKIVEESECVSINSHQMQAASLIKLYIAGCVYQNVDLIETYGNDIETIDQLVNLMLTISDNEAANALINILGNGNSAVGMNMINEYCKSYGYGDTHIGRLLLYPNDQDDNYTSVKDCGAFLENIYNNKVVGSEKILEYMKNQTRVSKIPAGIPAAVETANKTGELSDVENDVAIVWGDAKTYILCIMIDQVAVPNQAQALITDLSTQVYEALGK